MDKKLAMFLFVLFILACGAPVNMPIPTADMPIPPVIPTNTLPAATPSCTPGVVYNAPYGLHVRPAAGALSTYIAVLENGNMVCWRNGVVMPDMSLWGEVDGGWVNLEYIKWK